ncbi:MAG: hypothetical protein WKG32_14175 [Gemmatimonadaceae bacterium]
MSASRAILRATVLSLTLACARQPRADGAPAPETGPAAPATAADGTAATEAAATPLALSAELEVNNESIFDVRVYVIRAGQFRRLGTVTSMTTTSFELKAALIDRELMFYADPIGASTRQRTDAIYVRPGQQVAFRLEKKLRSYSLAVY